MGKYQRHNAASLRVSSIGMHFLACTLLSGAVGKYWLDPLFGTYPRFTLICGIMGIAAGFLNLYREVKIMDREDKEEELEREKSESTKDGNGEK